jgi:hypothetical protein
MSQCNGHGDYVDGSCFCDAGWFNSFCDENLKTKWLEAYQIYIGVFIASFSIMAIFSVKTLKNQLEER